MTDLEELVRSVSLYGIASAIVTGLVVAAFSVGQLVVSMPCLCWRGKPRMAWRRCSRIY